VAPCPSTPEFYDVTHRDHVVCNHEPLEGRRDGGYRHQPGRRILDIACGKGRPSFGSSSGTAYAVGVDLSPYVIRGSRPAWRRGSQARRPNCSDGRHDTRKPASLDLASCVGASWTFGDTKGLRAAWVKRVARSSRRAVRAGSQTPLPRVGRMTRDQFGTHAENVAAASRPDAALRARERGRFRPVRGAPVARRRPVRQGPAGRSRPPRLLSGSRASATSTHVGSRDLGCRSTSSGRTRRDGSVRLPLTPPGQDPVMAPPHRAPRRDRPSASPVPSVAHLGWCAAPAPRPSRLTGPTSRRRSAGSSGRLPVAVVDRHLDPRDPRSGAQATAIVVGPRETRSPRPRRSILDWVRIGASFAHRAGPSSRPPPREW
jgi:SAM-dependent methyltransferase